MRVSTRDIRHGPIRWLTRISGWFLFIGGIVNLFVQSDLLTIYLSGGNIQSILLGAFLIFLDILVGITDPEKGARRKPQSTITRVNRTSSAQNASSAAADVEKTYREIRNLLPATSNLPGLISQYGRDELIRKVKQDEDFCHSIFMRTLSQDVLDFIHTHNLIASYKIILELLKGAQKKQQEAQAAAHSGSSSGNKGENHINSFDKYMK